MSVQARREACRAWWKCHEVCSGFGPHMAGKALCSAQTRQEQVQVTAGPTERSHNPREHSHSLDKELLQYGSVMGGSGERAGKGKWVPGYSSTRRRQTQKAIPEMTRNTCGTLTPLSHTPKAVIPSAVW